MKQAIVFIMVLLGVAGYSTAARAQFLKNLVNKVVDSAVRRKATAGNTGNTGTRTDSTARGSKDSAMLAGIMANMSKPAGMTAADSAAASAAVKEFMTASSGSGMLYQYQTRYDIRIKGKDTVFVDTMSTAISDNRYTHVDMDMLGMKMTMIGRAAEPRYSVMLYPETKSYKLNVIDTARLSSGGGQTYQVTKIGTETVAGYSCVHSKLAIFGANKKLVLNEEIWASPAVPGYAQMKQDMGNAHVTVKMMQELQKAGCDGLIVKASGSSDQMSFVMQLVTAARKSFPASMFEIPAGYTAANNANIFNNMMLQQKATQNH
jgi:hypothetical protein